jgi:hypothetical protein
MADQYSPREDVSTVVSLLPVKIMERKPGLIPGFFALPAVADPRTDIEVLLVQRAFFPVYIDENRPSLIVPEPSDRVCAAIVRDYKVGLTCYDPDVAEPGLFWSPGKFTKAQALTELGPAIDQARDLQDMWFQRLVEQADDYWQKYHARRMVSSLQRRACAYLGLQRDWNIVDELAAQIDVDLGPCKFCRSMIHREAFVCPMCSGILDRAKARDAGYITAEMLVSSAKVTTAPTTTGTAPAK